MTQDLKNSLKIILNAYKDGKFTEEEVFTLLDSMINTNNCGSSIITYPYPVYPSYPYTPWETNPIYDLKPYCTTSTLDTAKNGEQDTKTSING